MNRKNWRRLSSWSKRCDMTPPGAISGDDTTIKRAGTRTSSRLAIGAALGALGRLDRFAVGVADPDGHVDVEVLFAGTTVVNRAHSTHRVELFPMAIRTDEHEVRAVKHGAPWFALLQQWIAPSELTGYEGWRRRADSNR